MLEDCWLTAESRQSALLVEARTLRIADEFELKLGRSGWRLLLVSLGRRNQGKAVCRIPSAQCVRA